MESLRHNLATVKDRVATACKSVGREPSEVTLIAVTKTVPIQQIQSAYDLGLRCFGESRFQEALPKIESLADDIEWHFIGKLQSNKAKRVATAFQVVHTIDSTTQLGEISKSPKKIDGLIEINIAQESQKSGIMPADLDEFIEKVIQCDKVRLRGLMTVGPVVPEAEQMRPHFRRLKELSERFAVGNWLSMGMSGDFEVAIQEGSTHIRVGSALFGSRT